jgi:hypothetical protein
MYGSIKLAIDTIIDEMFGCLFERAKFDVLCHVLCYSESAKAQRVNGYAAISRASHFM